MTVFIYLHLVKLTSHGGISEIQRVKKSLLQALSDSQVLLTSAVAIICTRFAIYPAWTSGEEFSPTVEFAVASCISSHRIVVSINQPMDRLPLLPPPSLAPTPE